MPKRLSSLLEIVQKFFDRFGNWNQICQAAVWYLKHLPILVPAPLSVTRANFAWFDFKILTCRTQSAACIHFKVRSSNVAGWIAAAKAVTVQGTVGMRKQNFGRGMRFHHRHVLCTASLIRQTWLLLQMWKGHKENLCNTPCRSHPTSKQTRKSSKQTKSQKGALGFGLCLSQWSQHAGGNNLFFSLCPPCPHPSFSKVFWELAFIGQSTNVENHKDVLIEKNQLFTASLGYLNPKQFSLFREDGLVDKIAIKPQNDKLGTSLLRDLLS